MSELDSTLPEPNPQEAIAEVLIAIGDGEPTTEQLAFLNAEADRVEGGVIVHSYNAAGKTEHRIPKGDYPHARPGTATHHIDDVARYRDSKHGAEILKEGPMQPATAEGISTFSIEHTYNYTNPDTKNTVRLDETLAKTLLEFSTYNRRLQSSIRSKTDGLVSVHKRLRSNNVLPDSGRVHIDENSYAKVKAFVETCSRMSDDYLEQKGFTKREASAIFAALQRDGTVDSIYTEGEGYLVSSRRHSEISTPARTRRQSLFTRAVNGLFSDLEEEAEKKPVVRAGASYHSASAIEIDTTSLQPITPVDITPKKLVTPVAIEKGEPTDYLKEEPYWKDIVRYIAYVASQAKPGQKPMISSTALTGKLPEKMGKAIAETIASDLYTKFTHDGIMRPITSVEERGRNSTTSVNKYQLMFNADEITDFYGVLSQAEKAKEDQIKRLYLSKQRVADVDENAIGPVLKTHTANRSDISHLPLREQLEAEISWREEEKDLRREVVRSRLAADFGSNIPEGLEDDFISELTKRAEDVERKKSGPPPRGQTGRSRS